MAATRKRRAETPAPAATPIDLGAIFGTTGRVSDEALAVLADSLLAAGDPWGEVMSAQARGDVATTLLDDPRVLGPVRAKQSRAKVRVLHGLAGGPLSAWFETNERADLDVLWRGGFVDTLDFHAGARWVEPTLLERRPLAALRVLLTTTHLPPGWNERPERLARLEVLDLGEAGPTERFDWIRRLPRLTRLGARVGRQVEAPDWPADLHHPTVRSLCVRLGQLSPALLAGVLRSFPRLEDLVLVTDVDADGRALAPLLEGDVGANVRGFALSTADDVTLGALVDAYRRGRFLRGLVGAGVVSDVLHPEVLAGTETSDFGLALKSAGRLREAVPLLERAVRTGAQAQRLNALFSLSLVLDDDPSVFPLYEAMHRAPLPHQGLTLSAWRNHVLTLCPVEDLLRASRPVDPAQARAALEIARRGIAANGEATTMGLADLHHLAASLHLALGEDASVDLERSVSVRRSLIGDGLSSVENRYYLAVSLCRLGRHDEALDQLSAVLKNDSMRAEATRETGLAPLRGHPRFLALLQNDGTP
ncbi:MAG: hypothetical protein SFW67_07580 [Myxococcaceae bacterium]|nr:hypothetical protein [Myxococcaceae bacterium]